MKVLDRDPPQETEFYCYLGFRSVLGSYHFLAHGGGGGRGAGGNGGDQVNIID